MNIIVPIFHCDQQLASPFHITKNLRNYIHTPVVLKKIEIKELLFSVRSEVNIDAVLISDLVT